MTTAVATNPLSSPLLGQSAPQLRAERLITSARVILAVFSLLAIWLHPGTPPGQVSTTYPLLGLYGVYAGVLAVIAWNARAPLPRFVGPVTHGIDLLLFGIFMYLTEGPASPFIAYYSFAIVAGTVRWQWRGAVSTAVIALLALTGIGLYAQLLWPAWQFELSRVISRTMYLVVVTALLASLGAYEQRRRREMSQLGAWPATLSRNAATAVQAVLSNAAAIVGARRALLVWEPLKEPWLDVALWTADKTELQQWHQPPGMLQSLVDPALTALHFVSDHAAAANSTVVHAAPGSPEQATPWQGTPIHRELVAEFAIRHVLALVLNGECGRGRLFLLDQPRLSADDLAIGQAIARRVTESLDHLALSRRLRGSAAAEERARLFRDLHDGVLQSLTGAAFKLQTAQRLLLADGVGARQKLLETQRLLVEEQRTLRLYISEAKRQPVAFGAGNLEAGLRQLLRHIDEVWGLRSTLDVRGWTAAGDGLAPEVGYLIREALVNAARHGHASAAGVVVTLERDSLTIDVADNGQGFAFHGDLDHETLTRRQLGPVMLKQRVGALDGSLAIHSASTGARLQIRVPLAPRDA